MEGEPLDAEALYRAHAPFVAGFLARLGARRDEMDDLLQEIFLVAHRRGGYSPGPARPTTWLAEIAFRVLANARRATERRQVAPPELVDEQLSTSPGPEQRAAEAESRARIQRCLDALDENHRVVLVLYELYGESCVEIADVLGVPVGTVYSRLYGARRKFQTAWEALARKRTA